MMGSTRPRHLLWAVEPISRSQRNDGFGSDSGGVEHNVVNANPFDFAFIEIEHLKP
jgi:hypothetical protein